ncbi:sedoheptulose-1,7-bisphosphatase [Xylaria bambusicola]|uniref:sedoheptulose-1,7-bisphosphatase n=1 Tax=Xylaria bambusicola TaxID=326684 RepID=UPI0020079629|nr:sedoheptulose-1,7-bisphosphatase [Xylaria bambusicola]KAI0509614.1 sedoheptulose-1,7-bisphosphatase [Xylaria bambusicola]
MSSQEKLEQSLRRATGDANPSLTNAAIPALLRGIARTGVALRKAHSVETAGSENVFGDAQLNVDVLAEEFFRGELAACPAVVAASSEEDPVETDVSTSSEDTDDVYAVAFDPLDGSSIIGPNWSVGSILGVWEGRSVLRQDPSKQVAAVLGVFGPRTTAVIAVRIPGHERDAVCVEVGLADDGSYEIIRSDVRLNAECTSKTRYFAPANLRSAAEDERYMGLVTRFIAERYTLRYSGGLVPDVVHSLVKGHGVYLSPVTAGSKAKLRRAFELLPVALIVECAGGMAIDPANGRRILETPLENLDEKAGLVCGTAGEVEKVKTALLG